MTTTSRHRSGSMKSRIRLHCSGIVAVLAVATAGVVAQVSPATAQSRPNDLAANSRVIVDYIDPRTPRSQVTVDRLRKRQVLEELSMFLSPLRLPRILRIRTKSCGQVNAFYVPS